MGDRIIETIEHQTLNMTKPVTIVVKKEYEAPLPLTRNNYPIKEEAESDGD